MRVRNEVDNLKALSIPILCLSLLFLTSCGTVPSSPSSSPAVSSAEQPRSFPSFQYDGSDPTEALIYKTEEEQNPVSKAGCFLIPAPQIIKTCQEGDLLKVFFISDGETFLCQDTNSLIVDSSWCFPVAVTYKKENEKYVFQQYEMPAEGAYEKSIRSFCVTPKTGKEISGLADKMMDIDFDSQERKMKKNLKKYLAKNDLKNMQVKRP